jgi:site-specific DNA-cytosine methylase
MASALEKQGYKIAVLCELQEHLQTLLQRKFKGANVQPNMNDKPWRRWAECGLIIAVLVAGVACQPFSTAGLLREQHDSRAFQALLVLEAAIALQSTIVILENVRGLVENDSRHGVYSVIKAKFKSAGFKRHVIATGVDHECGGDTGRDRIWLLFSKEESKDNDASLHEQVHIKVGEWEGRPWPVGIPISDPGSEPWGRIQLKPPKAPGGAAGYITLQGELGKIGQAVTLRGREGSWRVMEADGAEHLKLMNVDRRGPAKLTVHREELEALDVRHSSFPVYRPGDRLPTLTASGEPPRLGAGLVANERGEVFTMGILARAHLHRLPQEDTQFLQEIDCDLGQMRAALGGMVPVNMADAVMRTLVPLAEETQPAATKTVPEAGKEPMARGNAGQIWTEATRGVKLERARKDHTLVVVIPVGRKERTVQTGHERALGVVVPSGKVATGKIIPLVQHLLPGVEMALAGRHQTDRLDCWVVAALETQPDLKWKPKHLAELEDTAAHGPAALALARVLSFGGKVSREELEALLDTTCRSLGGARAPAPLGVRPPEKQPSASPQELQSARKRATADAKLHHALLAETLRRDADAAEVVIRGESKAEYLREWASQLTNVEQYMGQAPSSCLLQPACFTDERLASLPLVDTAPIYATERLPPVPEQEPLPDTFEPQSLSDLKEADTVETYNVEMKKHVSFLRLVADTDLDQGQLGKKRPRPTAFSELTRVPEARGRVFDLRSGKPKLLQMNAKVDCELDAGYFRKMLPDHIDQQIPQFMEEGVRSQAQLPLQSVLQSHLLSLANHTEDLGKDIERRDKLKYLSRHRKQPFDPLRLNPQGTTPKSGSIRQISDLGQPRTEVVDDLEEPVKVFNEQAKTDSEGEQRLPHEWKAHPPHILNNMAVLRYIGDLCGLVLYMFSDDLKDFFRQFAIHPSELWMLPFLWLGADGEEEFIVEERMGFGLAHASNVAQRFSNAVIQIFKKEFEKVDRPYLEADCRKHPLLRQWLEHRAMTLGAEQATLFSCCFYTDDLLGMVLGADRWCRALGVWFEVTRKLNLLCSAPRKRMGGVALTWTGLNWYSTLGGASLTEDKEADALRRLAKSCSGTMEVAQYRSIVGLLEWARFALGIQSTQMYQLYGPMKKGQELSQGPTTLVRATKERVAQWRRWANLISTACFAAASMALGGRPAPQLTSKVHVWHGDAAIRGTNHPGLCGFWAGLFWIFKLQPRHIKYLHITALELLTVLGNFLIFGPMLDLLDDEALAQVTILIQCDSLVSTMVLIGKPGAVALKSTAKSPLMQYVHQLLVDLPQYRRLQEVTVAGHEWGEGNILSDAGSRGREDKLLALCELLSIKARKVEIPEEVTHTLERAVRFAMELQGLDQGGATTEPGRKRSSANNWEKAPNKNQKPTGEPMELTTKQPLNGQSQGNMKAP